MKSSERNYPRPFLLVSPENARAVLLNPEADEVDRILAEDQLRWWASPEGQRMLQEREAAIAREADERWHRRWSIVRNVFAFIGFVFVSLSLIDLLRDWVGPS